MLISVSVYRVFSRLLIEIAFGGVLGLLIGIPTEQISQTTILECDELSEPFVDLFTTVSTMIVNLQVFFLLDC